MSKRMQFTSPMQTGFGLVELMIALVISLIVTTVIANVYIATKSTYRLQDNLARIQESGRFSVETMARFVRLAGFRANPGVASATAFPTGYGTIAGAAGEVTVRHFGSGATGTPDNTVKDCAGVGRAGDERVRHRFYITGTNLMCDTSYEDSGGTTQPTTTVKLAENVESMTTLFGLDTDADTSANYYVNAATVPVGSWGQVVAVQICILVKSKEGKLTSGSQSYVGCDLTTHTASDGYFHRPFRATITLRNPQSVL